MAKVTAKVHEEKKLYIMEKCFECYAEHGFNSVGIKGLAKSCGISSGNLYSYFENLDELIILSTEYCMGKVEDEFMAKAPPMWRTYGGLLTRYPIGRQKTTARNTDLCIRSILTRNTENTVRNSLRA